MPRKLKPEAKELREATQHLSNSWEFDPRFAAIVIPFVEDYALWI